MGTQFLNPEQIINQLDVKKGSLVADFGCASGYFSLPFAAVIGKEGKMMALDILPHVLETVESRAKASGLSNVQTKRVNLEKEEGSGLEKECLDWVIMKGVLFQNKDKAIILKEAHRVLKKGGKVIVVEWGDKDFSIGPHQSLRIPKEFLLELAKKEGFSIEKEVDAGKFHYAFVAVK
ncbi:MAG: Methylase involved in ubiquinone/menaquinone biosynthesis [Parcubacteria group bacterium GW2011_GWC1_45_14]|nr:MAG: Methylase involved in ubiquinone/menaquinone biosynthesis [Candidatus Moranbacteria bacterium GW2011_GWC2_45_10]KKT94739.1 MAG: Methylase involved in ubiquinone/menaquinone biosynthesis [Parcubacteria group bacterium GW2011_GWC1_45_14]